MYGRHYISTKKRFWRRLVKEKDTVLIQKSLGAFDKTVKFAANTVQNEKYISLV